MRWTSHFSQQRGSGPWPLRTCLGSSGSRLQVVAGTDGSSGSHAHLWICWEEDGAVRKTPEEDPRPLAPAFLLASLAVSLRSLTARASQPVPVRGDVSFAHNLFGPGLPSPHCPHSWETPGQKEDWETPGQKEGSLSQDWLW